MAALPLLVLACSQTDSTDELAGDSSTDAAVDGKADGAIDGASTYFEVGTSGPGFRLARLNRNATTCHDSSSKASCWVPVLDWSESSLTPPTQQKLLDAAGKNTLTGGVFGIVRGRFAKTNSTTHPTWGRFIVTEAWVAEGTGMADGIFARVVDNGIRCITTPCSSMTEKGLNESSTAMIAALDFSPAGLSDRQVEGFQLDIADPAGILVAGSRYTDHENGHTAKGRTVTNAYHQLVDVAVCRHAGCSQQLCSDAPSVITTCEWKAEYACYQAATCARQADGACGFTQTPELASCLGNLN